MYLLWDLFVSETAPYRRQAIHCGRSGQFETSRSGFYRWVAAEPDRVARGAAEQHLVEAIRRIPAESGGTYGWPRVTAELREQGRPVNHNVPSG